MSTPQPSEVAALRQAGEILRFISESPKDVPGPIPATITEAWEAEKTNQWNPEIASRFWTAYSSLCTLLKPSSVAGILANLKPVDRPWWMFWPQLTQPKSLSRRTADRYLWLMMILLILAVILSFIASATTNLDSEISKLLESANKIVEKIDADVDQLELTVKDKRASNQAITPEDRKLFKQIQLEVRDSDVLVIQINKKYDTISRLLFVFRIKPFRFRPGTLNDDQSVTEFRSSILHFYQERQRWIAYRQDVLIITSIIYSAILPIVLGMMGACSYVVRMISDQIRETTFTGTSPIRHLVRVALGALAGVVIGYGGIFTGTGLSSAALSFIAGYAVEPVFATFDSIAERFKQPA